MFHRPKKGFQHILEGRTIPQKVGKRYGGGNYTLLSQICTTKVKQV